VYSYGIVVWETYNGQIPFSDQSSPQLAAYSAAVNGLRPPLTDAVPTGVAFLVQDCWHANAALRPAFEVKATDHSLFLALQS
jgi:Protein tyrosine and serine/threonine kinase